MNKKTAVHRTVPPYNMIANWLLVVPSMFLRSCKAIKKIIICIHCIQQNTQAYFQNEGMICAQACYNISTAHRLCYMSRKFLYSSMGRRFGYPIDAHRGECLESIQLTWYGLRIQKVQNL